MAHSNIRWVVLTNGVVWNLYHLTFDEGIDATVAFTVDLTPGVTDQAAELLALLHRTSIVKGELDTYWEHRIALGPASIGKAIFQEATLKLIRRDVRKREGVLIDEEDLAVAIHEMLSVEARERIGPLKIRRSKKKKKPTTAVDGDHRPAPESAPEKGDE